MPDYAWNDKVQRHYEYAEQGLEEPDRSDDESEEIAAPTVEDAWARAGEAEASSRSSIEDISSARRGGPASHRATGGPTYDQLYNEARERGIKGRSRMNKTELARAVGR